MQALELFDRLGMLPTRTHANNDTIIARLHVLVDTGAHLMTILLHYVKHHHKTILTSWGYGLVKFYVGMQMDETAIVTWVEV